MIIIIIIIIAVDNHQPFPCTAAVLVRPQSGEIGTLQPSARELVQQSQPVAVSSSPRTAQSSGKYTHTYIHTPHTPTHTHTHTQNQKKGQ